jgi:hypothetical protein
LIICISIYILNTEFQNWAERRSVGVRFLTSNTYCPQDPAQTERQMNLYVGTSGYSYKEWKGTFYPDDLSGQADAPLLR